MWGRDYRWYIRYCRTLGKVLIIVGIILPILTAREIRYKYDIFPPEWSFPYLGYGITITIVGIAVTMSSRLLSRGRKVKSKQRNM